jgi:hypothetical protein
MVEIIERGEGFANRILHNINGSKYNLLEIPSKCLNSDMESFILDICELLCGYHDDVAFMYNTLMHYKCLNYSFDVGKTITKGPLTYWHLKLSTCQNFSKFTLDINKVSIAYDIDLLMKSYDANKTETIIYNIIKFLENHTSHIVYSGYKPITDLIIKLSEDYKYYASNIEFNQVTLLDIKTRIDNLAKLVPE